MKNKPKEKTPELYAAKRALANYFKVHNLDPTDTKLMKDPVHGKYITDLVNKLNKERDKVMLNYPASDRSNNLKLLKMSKEAKKKAKDKKKVQEVAPAKEKKSVGRTTTKYDYPQVKDEKTGKMRDMTSDEKKKYRVEARKKASGDTTKVKKEKKSEAPVDTKEKKSKKDKVDKKKDKKKAKKDED